MANSMYRRHNISDALWNKLESHLSGRKRTWGAIAKDNRLFINTVFWVFRTGASWRDLAADYGGRKNTHRRFIRWRDKGLWEFLLEIIVEDPDYEWLIIGASHIKMHPHTAGAKGGNQDMNRTKGGSTRHYIWPWMRMVCRSELLLRKVPLRIVHK